jgi:hypothetical protein
VCRFIGEKQARALIGKLARSLRPGGILLVADVFFSDDRSGPPAALTLDLSMLVNTSQGQIRTCGEISAWLKDSGLSETRRFDGLGPFPILAAQKGEDV